MGKHCGYLGEKKVEPAALSTIEKVDAEVLLESFFNLHTLNDARQMRRLENLSAYCAYDKSNLSPISAHDSGEHMGRCTSLPRRLMTT